MKAGELQDKIGDINQEISALGSDTRGIDNVVRGASLIVNSFQMAEGMKSIRLGKLLRNRKSAVSGSTSQTSLFVNLKSPLA